MKTPQRFITINRQPALTAGEKETLIELASKDDVQSPSLELIAWLGAALREADAREAAVDVLRAAQAQNPGDFWLNFELGKALVSENAIEATGFVRAALAVRPDSSGALWCLALILREAGQLDESVRAFHRLKQLQLNDFWVRYNGSRGVSHRLPH